MEKWFNFKTILFLVITFKQWSFFSNTMISDYYFGMN